MGIAPLHPSLQKRGRRRPDGTPDQSAPAGASRPCWCRYTPYVSCDEARTAAARLDADRRGYVIAIGETSVEALERAEAAAGLLAVEVG